MADRRYGTLLAKSQYIAADAWTKSRSIALLITIMAVLSAERRLPAQEVTIQAPPTAIPDAPRPPDAILVPPAEEGVEVTIRSDLQSERYGHFVLDGNVEIVYGSQADARTVRADHIEYDKATGEVVATGHLVATGGRNSERIAASHGTLNMKTQTGRFYDVSGSVGLALNGSRMVYKSANPFLFTGRMVVRTGPSEYQVYDGTVTSCQLPHPDWLLSAGLFSIDSDKATARNSVFHLLNVPLLYLPYVTHPVDAEERQSGLLIPVLGQSSSKGFITGEEVYLTLGRSADLTVGATYYSLRGWAQAAAFRYKGRDNDFAIARYTGLLDHGYTPASGIYTNQGGEDLTFRGRHDFSDATRAVADVEYLSSYTYREAFTDNFNQAVSSDILSTVYGQHTMDGTMASVRADRYQGLKRAATLATATTPATSEQQIRIFHAPSLDFDAADHRIGPTPLLWNLESSASALKRVQPNFVTGGTIERFDLHPQLSLPIAGGGLHLLPSVGVRETLYTRNRKTPYTGGPPVEGTGGLSRSDFEANIDARLPVLARTFTGPLAHRLFGADVRHTIEPYTTYRYVTGVGNFLNVLRFDDKDVVSNTDEIEYGTTQRLFVKQRDGNACADSASPIAAASDEETTIEANCTTSQRLAWRVAQKYFFNSNFGGAVTAGRRNILDTTLAFSGIAFLTEARDISPLISRLRVQTSEKTSIEWNFDYDTGAKKFTSNNIFVDVRQGKTFGGLSYARLNAPGRFYTEGVSSSVSNFNQFRVLLGYGSPTKAGLGIAANAGIDLNIGSLQYAALQTSYNWNCCGFSAEYRKYELGAVRNENAYRFNFTLANIGTAGNLRRAERLF